MPNFDLKRIKGVKGKLTFYQLTIDDKPENDGNENDDEKNEKKTGVLDIFEQELERIYYKDIDQIYAYMNMVANNEHVSGKKYHLLDRTNNDPYQDFEFKHGDLRLYGIKIPNGKIIFLGGYKNKQEKDIKKLRSLKKQYFDSLKQKK